MGNTGPLRQCILVLPQGWRARSSCYLGTQKLDTWGEGCYQSGVLKQEFAVLRGKVKGPEAESE